MSERVKGGVEILVHTTAPSRGKDDTHYRALTLAYRLFEPAKRLSLADDLDDEDLSSPEESWDAQALAECPNSTSKNVATQPVCAGLIDSAERSFDLSQVESEVSALESQYGRSRTEEHNLIESPYLSFNSVVDNLDSPALHRPGGILRTPHPSLKRTAPSPTPEVEDSWSTPPSVIPDSQPPFRLTSQDFPSPTSVLELYLKHFNGSAPQEEEPASTNRDLQRISSPEILCVASSDNPRGSVIKLITPVPLSLATNEIVRETPPAPPKQQQDILQVIKQTPLSPSKSNCQPRVKPVPGHAKFCRHESAPPKPIQQALRPSSRSSHYSSQPPKRRRLSITTTQAALSSIPYPAPIKTWTPSPPSIVPWNEIHPPLPSTNTNVDLPSPLTPALRNICDSVSLTRSYRPLTQKRLLRSEERGYWAIPMQEWEQALREQVWRGLKVFVGSGKAGWAVWCLLCGAGDGDGIARSRDGNLDCDSNDQNERRKHAKGDPSNWAELRVYCWGGVVAEIWLMLYIVSRTKIKGRGARWIDGGGEAVVIMS